LDKAAMDTGYGMVGATGTAKGESERPSAGSLENKKWEFKQCHFIPRSVTGTFG
jgi:hypothetical protein